LVQRRFSWASILLHRGRPVDEHLRNRPTVVGGDGFQVLDLILGGYSAIRRRSSIDYNVA
jgi:hypothetical protein